MAGARVLTVGPDTRKAISQARCTALLHASRPSWRPEQSVTITRKWHDDPVTGGQKRDEHLSIVIDEVSEITLGDFTRAEAAHFGVRRPLDVMRLFLDSNDQGWRYRLGFTLEDHIPAESITEHWNATCRGQRAWRTRFRAVTPDRPRLLAASSQFGYVDSPHRMLGSKADDPGEAPPEDWQIERSREAFNADMAGKKLGRQAHADFYSAVRAKRVTPSLADPNLTAADRRALKNLDKAIRQAVAHLRSDAA